jgi:hypothetical protein
MIPKPGTAKRRRPGIPTVRDRVVQAALKLVLEPIFEADFLPCSYGFRPKRRAHDAIAETHHLTRRSYEWVVEGDIEACFDSIDHTALMAQVGRRVGDKCVLALLPRPRRRRPRHPITLAFSGGLVEWNLRSRVTSTSISGLARGLPCTMPRRGRHRCLWSAPTDLSVITDSVITAFQPDTTKESHACSPNA